jgi:hypothetical protein
VPRIDPPVGILGRPTIDFRFSGFLGVSQSRWDAVLENGRLHLGDAWSPRHGVRRDIRMLEKASRRDVKFEMALLEAISGRTAAALFFDSR